MLKGIEGEVGGGGGGGGDLKTSPLFTVNSGPPLEGHRWMRARRSMQIWGTEGKIDLF